MITITTDFDSLRNALRRASRKLSDPRDLMQDAAQFAVERLEETYTAENDPYGVPWAPLAPSTLRQKAGSAILIEKGSLNASLGYNLLGSQAAEIGYVDYKAKWHQDGTSKMPARPIVPDDGLPSEWEPRLETLIEGYLKEALW